MRHDNKLHLPEEMLEILRILADIDLIERRVDLIENTEGRRTQLQDRKIDADRDEGLLTAGERDQILDDLAGRRDLDLDTGFKDMLRIGQFQRSGAAAEEFDENLTEILIDLRKALLEDDAHIVCQLFNELLQFRFRGLDVLDLTGHEAVALRNFLILIDGRNIDRTESPDAVFQRTELLFGLTDILDRLCLFFGFRACQLIGILKPENEVVYFLLNIIFAFFDAGSFKRLLLTRIAQTVHALADIVCMLFLFIVDAAQLPDLILHLGDRSASCILPFRQFLDRGLFLGNILLFQLNAVRDPGELIGRLFHILRHGNPAVPLGFDIFCKLRLFNFLISDRLRKHRLFTLQLCLRFRIRLQFCSSLFDFGFKCSELFFRIRFCLLQLCDLLIQARTLIRFILLPRSVRGSADMERSKLLLQIILLALIFCNERLCAVDIGQQLRPFRFPLCSIGFEGIHLRFQTFEFFGSFFQFMCPGDNTGRPCRRTARIRTARMNDLTVERDDPEFILELSRNARSSVNILCDSDASEQTLHDIAIDVIESDEIAGQRDKAVNAVEPFAEPSAADRCQRQECRSSASDLLQIADAALCGILIFNNEILQCTAERGFDRGAVLRFHGDALCNGTVYTAEPAASGDLEDLPDAARIAFHILFQIAQDPLLLLHIGIFGAAFADGILCRLKFLFTDARKLLKAVQAVLLFKQFLRSSVDLFFEFLLFFFILFQPFGNGRAVRFRLADGILSLREIMRNARDPDALCILLQIEFAECGILLTDRIPLLRILRSECFELLHLRGNFLFENSLLTCKCFEITVLFREFAFPFSVGIRKFGASAFKVGNFLIAVRDLIVTNSDIRGHACIFLLRRNDFILQRFDINRCLLHILKRKIELFLLPLQIILQILIFSSQLQIAFRECLELRGLPSEPIDPEGDFEGLALGRENEIFLGLFGLCFERTEAAFQFRCDIGQAHKIFLCLREFPLGFLFAVAEFGDTGGLLKDIAALIGFCTDDLRDSALSDDRVTVSSETGIHKEFIDILEADISAVDEIFAVAAAVEFSSDGDLILRFRESAVAVVNGQRDGGKSHLLARFGAGEDDILHAFSAQLLGRLLTEHPAHRITDIALAAAVRTDNRSQTLVKGQSNFIGKRFEALQLQ